MPRRFIGRHSQLALLEGAYQSSESAFIPVYGRRRVGKSELLLQFLRTRQGIYFLGKRAPAELQIKEFLREAAVALAEPLLANQRVDGWAHALQLVTDRWPSGEKLVLVLDEFQWMAGASPELPSVVQGLWDRVWRDSGKMMVILCGSFIGFMEREVLGRKSPLFGRRTAQILLRPFGFAEAARFQPAYSLPDQAMAYFICGGVPLYLNGFRDDRAVEQNIAENLLNEYAPLYREPDFLLKEELREVDNYYAILLAVATGSLTNREIARASGIEERSLHYYLKQLLELGYLARRYPLTGSRTPRVPVRYVLEDPLLRFWFRFVYPNTTFISRMGAASALTNRVRPHLDSYVGLCFERLCREALPTLYAAEGVGASFEVGEYWDKAVQIDVVGLRDDGWTDLGECRWGKVRSPQQLVRELDGRVIAYPNPKNATIGRRIFVRNPVPSQAFAGTGIKTHCLMDMYNAAD